MPTASPQSRRIAIDLGERSYDILIGRGLIDDPRAFDGVPRSPSAAIVTNTTVAPLYAVRLKHALASIHQDLRVIELDDGEQFKDWRSLDRIYDALLAARADRRTVLYALGGGVVGDIAGFAAATYMRGIPFVQVPTTLLAQVDSSVGGKTAINHPRGKNMIGAFYQPVRVVADLDTIDTLPPREVAAGLAEVIKYGPIADATFLDWIESHIDALVARDKGLLAQAVARSCEIKADVVAQDEREGGLRAILNFGHTFGHAIEAVLGYGQWLHGEAVGCGMVMAADLSARLGLATSADARRITRLVERAGLPIRAPALDAAALMELMRIDKKSQGGEIRFVVVDGRGHACVHAAPDEMVRDVLTAHCA